ncbi:class I SAM-dependent methyltransferase [soil metagenome]
MISPVGAIDEYLDLDPLSVRIETHQRYSEHYDDVEQAALDALPLTDVSAVLDIGCGTGSFLRRLRSDGRVDHLAGLDQSPAAVQSLAELPDVAAVLGDACFLPFDDAQFDVVTARHMLYHVADVSLALRESMRVTRAGGRLVAIVNHAGTTPHVERLVRDAVAHVTGLEPASGMPRVHSDNAPGFIRDVYGNVAVRPYDNALIFRSPEPLVSYAVALLAFFGIGTDDPARPDVARQIDRRARAALATQGLWRDPKGYVVCVAQVPSR